MSSLGSMGFADNHPPPAPPACPLCGKALRDLERVEARHTPASVPEHERSLAYTVVRRYVVVECENGHRMERRGSDLMSSKQPVTVWGNR